jgi:hypothetical protein
MQTDKFVSIITFRNLCETKEFLSVLETISSHNPDKVVVIDPFQKKDFDQKMILSHLIEGSGREFIFYSFEGEFNMPDGVEVMGEIEKLKEATSTTKDFVVLIPRTIRHALFATAVLRDYVHPAFDHVGKLSSDARWIIEERGSTGDYDAMLQRAASYALPYPDLIGDGSELLDELDAAITGMNYFMDEGFVKEFVENSIRIVENQKRCFRNHYNGVIEVYAASAGNFHSGTLMALIKDKWPEAKWVVIRCYGDISRRSGKFQVSLACLDEGENLDRFREFEGEISFASDKYVHMSSDLFFNTTFP